MPDRKKQPPAPAPLPKGPTREPSREDLIGFSQDIFADMRNDPRSVLPTAADERIRAYLDEAGVGFSALYPSQPMTDDQAQRDYQTQFRTAAGQHALFEADELDKYNSTVKKPTAKSRYDSGLIRDRMVDNLRAAGVELPSTSEPDLKAAIDQFRAQQSRIKQ